MHSFGDKGNRVIRTLRNSTPSSFKHISTLLQRFIADAKPEWLDGAIDARNRVNHYQKGGINPDHFVVVVVQKGDEIEVHQPMWSNDQKVSEMLEIVWDQLIQFSERFLFASLSYKLPDALGPLFLSRGNVKPGESQVRIVDRKEITERLGPGELVEPPSR